MGKEGKPSGLCTVERGGTGDTKAVAVPAPLGITPSISRASGKLKC